MCSGGDDRFHKNCPHSGVFVYCLDCNLLGSYRGPTHDVLASSSLRGELSAEEVLWLDFVSFCFYSLRAWFQSLLLFQRVAQHWILTLAGVLVVLWWFGNSSCCNGRIIVACV